MSPLHSIDSINIVGEGPTDIAVARRLCALAGLSVSREFACGGKQRLDAKLPKYNEAARRMRWFVLRDLDNDDACAPALTALKLANASDGMLFRVPVRMVEAWLLADHRGLAKFLRVPHGRIPRDPENIADPKGSIVSISASSRERRVREGLCPPPRSRHPVGPQYTAMLTEFVTNLWDPESAAQRADSLKRTLFRLREK